MASASYWQELIDKWQHSGLRYYCGMLMVYGYVSAVCIKVVLFGLR